MKDTANTTQAKLMLLSAMAIWGSIGIIRHYIPVDSGTLALLRSVIGAVCMALLLAVLRRHADWAGIRANGRLLVLSGFAVGINWLLLFEAFKHTSVAVATVCYYMAPIGVMLFSPLVLGEPINRHKGLGILMAFIGIAFVSGLFSANNAGVTLTGVLYGLGAATFYMSVVLLNKRMTPMEPYTKTGVQLAASATVLLPYIVFQQWNTPMDWAIWTPTVIGLTLILGFVYTGLACALYFGSMDRLPAQTVALFSYLDPILAVILSTVLLGEPLTPSLVIGTVLVLGGAFIGERQPKARS